MKILLTGITGFIGGALLEALLEGDHKIIAIVRAYSRDLPCDVEQIVVGDFLHFSKKKFYDSVDDLVLLKNIDCFVHLAAMTSEDYGCEKINKDLPLQLCEIALELKVKRFLFLSSIKVNGEYTVEGERYTHTLKGNPKSLYGVCKHEAEKNLFSMVSNRDMELVIIRPPLVYGPGVKGNFSSMMRLVRKGVPLPLACVTNNRRSLIALENLISFIICCIDYNKSPKASNQIFLISDGEDVSTRQLFKKIATAYKVKLRLLPFPIAFLRFLAFLLNKKSIADRLLESLVVDNSNAFDLLAWKPVITMDEQLKKMAINSVPNI